MIIPGILERVPEVCEFVVEAATNAGLDDRAVYHCQMAVDEWCTNIVEHSFNKGSRIGRIEVTCGRRYDQFMILISDDAPPFDPTTLSDVDPHKPLEEREPGGLGWFFIRKVMDELHYEFRDGRNYLTMYKNGAQPVQKAMNSDVYPSSDADGGVRLLTLRGRLDSTTSRALETALSGQLSSGHSLLVLDMREVSYVSSSGLKAILTALRQANRSGGNVALAGLAPRVLEIFQISGFDTLFIIEDSPEAAIVRIAAANA